MKVLIIGGGLAGSDCAWFLAQRGCPVIICESKKLQRGAAQKTNLYGELVCTNSLKSMDRDSAHGILKGEMEAMGSLVYDSALQCRVPAGQALAVDRNKFSVLITKNLRDHPLITLVDREVDNPMATLGEWECDVVVVATGPLTTPSLERWIQKNLSGEENLYFYDAIAPVVEADSLDLRKMYFRDRYGTHGGSADYLNAPLCKQEYESFVEQLRLADKVPPQNFEEFRYFESCLPIDVTAERGENTLRFSCMKPVGLEKEDGTRPYGVVQLRRENLLGDAYNLVGFQTKLTYSEQLRVFRQLPGFEKAEFLHLGSVHRNTFINSKKLLHKDLSCRTFPQLYFAGQITGVEGYTESAAMGLYVGAQILRKLGGLAPLELSPETAMGALVNYLMTVSSPSPSSINFGLFPSLDISLMEGLSKEQRRGKKRKAVKKLLVARRARDVWREVVL